MAEALQIMQVLTLKTVNTNMYQSVDSNLILALVKDLLK